MVVAARAAKDPLIKELAEILRAHGARDVYVFGSVATEGVGKATDIDLAVSGLPPERYFPALAKLTFVSDKPVDLVDLDEDTPFVRHLLAGGLLGRVG